MICQRPALFVVALSSLVAAPAFAAEPDPVEISAPRAGDVYRLGQGGFQISPGRYLNAKKYECKLTQGTTVWQGAASEFPICKLSESDLAKFKPGKAEASVRVFYKNAWLKPAQVSFEFKEGTPRGGVAAAAGPPTIERWAGRYDAADNPGRHAAALSCPRRSSMIAPYVTVEGGKLSFTVVVDPTGANLDAYREKGARFELSVPVAADGKVSATAPFTPETLALVASPTGKALAGVTGLRVEGSTGDEGEGRGRSRKMKLTVTGGAASCSFEASASGR